MLDILIKLVTGEELGLADWQAMELGAIADESRSRAFGITPANVSTIIKRRSHLFRSVYPEVQRLCPQIPENLLLSTLWNLWLPLGMQLGTARQQGDRPLVQGILGGQGTGKTTLGAVLKLILQQLGYNSLSLSINDLYLTYAERQQLKQQDPRLVWRGPPGTHDVKLGMAVLHQLRDAKGRVEIPRFDKSAWGGEGDRTAPEVVRDIDIVFFEGWFVGVRPIDPIIFDSPPSPIITAGDLQFARDMNERLLEYLPLWEYLDRLLVLYPTDYRLSREWRQQAEREVIAAGKSGMTDGMIDEFVQYFWRSLHPELFVKLLISNPELVDLVVEINPDRSPGAVYQPGDF